MPIMPETVISKSNLSFTFLFKAFKLGKVYEHQRDVLYAEHQVTQVTEL